MPCRHRLIIESLESSLDDLLTQGDQIMYMSNPTPDIPLVLKVSMLKDVVKGLHYLHNRSPNPIAHRELSAKDVVLGSSTTAKISDLGPCNSCFLSANVHTEGTIYLHVTQQLKV